MKQILLAVVFSLALAVGATAPAPVFAEDAGEAPDGGGLSEDERAERLQAAEQALAAGEATRAHKALAEIHGAAEAAYRIGLRFESGDGAPANQSRAWRWFKQAADQGHALGHTKAAEYLAGGIGTALDRRQALTHYRSAAELGNARAQAMLGLWQLRGIGTRVNYIEGVRNLRAAAAAGEPMAVAELQRLEAAGHPVEIEKLRAPPELEGQARRVLDAAHAMLAAPEGAPFRFDLGAPTAVVAAGDGYDVTVPGLRVVTDAGTSLDLGTVRAHFRPAGASDYDVSVDLPSDSVVRDAEGAEIGSLSFGEASFAGRWSAEHGVMLAYSARLASLGMTVTDRRGTLTLAADAIEGVRVAEARPDGRHDLREDASARGITLRLRETGAGMEAAIGAVTVGARYDGADIGALAAFVGGGTGAPSAPMRGLLSGGDVAVDVTDISAGGAGGTTLGRVRHLRLRVGGRVEDGLGRVDLETAYEGLALAAALAGEGPPPPAAARAALSLRRLPLDVLDPTVVMGLSPSVLPAIMAAGTELVVEEISAAAEDYGFDLRGRLRPEAAGAVGTLVLSLRGLDRLLADQGSLGHLPLGRDDIEMIEAMRPLARDDVDAEGRPVEVFSLEFGAEGLLVNGQPAPLNPLQAPTGSARP